MVIENVPAPKVSEGTHKCWLLIRLQHLQVVSLLVVLKEVF
jgi:hypothetical protein